MSQTFRKYINNRGSALFMVLSTMSALFLLVTAMYFSVVSSRSVQYAVFNQEQAYQSSISVSDALVAALRSGKATTLSNEILKLAAPTDGAKTGGSISTGGNGFAEFLGEAGGATFSNDQLGAYTVDITRLSDATENGTVYKVFDFAITTSVGGVLETTHTFVRYTGVATDSPNIFGTGMTSTGYVPNSPRLNRGTYESPLRYDSEYCVIGGDGSAGWTVMKNDLTCTGTAKISGANPNNGGNTKPLTWVFGNDLILAPAYSYSVFVFSPDMNGTKDEHGIVVVGGDLIVDGQKGLYIPQYTDVFVFGDVIIHRSLSLEGRLFVAGNILFEDPDEQGWGIGSISINNGMIYLGGSLLHADTNAAIANISNISGKISTLDKESQDWKNACDIYDQKMTSPSYEKWSIIGDDKTIPKTKLFFNNSHLELEYGSNKYPAQTMTNTELSIDNYPNGVIIEEMIDVAEWTANEDAFPPGTVDKTVLDANVYSIVIDTGEDENGIFKIKLMPNHDYDGDGINETFTWLPIDDPKFKSSGDKSVNVLVKGRGTLLLEVPNGSTYQAAHFETFMHINWYAMLGGKRTTNSFGQTVYTAINQLNSGATAITDGWIHSIAKCNGDVECEIVQKTSEGEDGILGTDDDEQIHFCNTHKRKVTYSEISNDCGCYGVVERTVIDSYIKYNKSMLVTAGLYDNFKDSSGNTIYPNVNTMIVSNDESAQIRLSSFDDGSNVSQNTFWGWIYAPYMTYIAKPAGEGSGGTRLVGGIIVSDYISDDWYSFVYCRPDEASSLAINSIKDGNGGFAGHSWKVSGY